MVRTAVRWSCAVILITAAPLAGAQVYRWVDERGVTHYGAQPGGQSAARVESKPAAGTGNPTRQAPAQPIVAARSAASPGVNPRPEEPPRKPMLGSPEFHKSMADRVATEARDKAVQRCRDNRGARCDDPATVRQYMNEDRPLTEDERRCVMAARNTGSNCKLARDLPVRSR